MMYLKENILKKEIKKKLNENKVFTHVLLEFISALEMMSSYIDESSSVIAFGWFSEAAKNVA